MKQFILTMVKIQQTKILETTLFISEGGNNLIRSISGDDYLDGQVGFDRLNGNSDVDTCINDEILRNF